MNVSAVFCDSHRFEVVHPFPFTQSCKNLLLLLQPVQRNDKRDGLANRFLRRPAEKTLRAGVPRLNDAIQVLADDGIVGGFDNRSKLDLRINQNWESVAFRLQHVRAFQRVTFRKWYSLIL